MVCLKKYTKCRLLNLKFSVKKFLQSMSCIRSYTFQFNEHIFYLKNFWRIYARSLASGFCLLEQFQFQTLSRRMFHYLQQVFVELWVNDRK